MGGGCGGVSSRSQIVARAESPEQGRDETADAAGSGGAHRSGAGGFATDGRGLGDGGDGLCGGGGSCGGSRCFLLFPQ